MLIVYDPATLIPIRWIVPDYDYELQDPAHIQAGEAGLVVEDANPLTASHTDILHHLSRHHGVAVDGIPHLQYMVVHDVVDGVITGTHLEAR